MALTLPNTFLQIKPSIPSVLLTDKVVRARSGNHGMQATCRKTDIHPQFHEDAKVFCNGELVMTTGGTQKEYVIDVWSGNHPFYLGSRSGSLVDDDQVAKFRKRFAGIPQIMEIPVLKGDTIVPPKRISISRKGSSQKKK